MNPTSPDTSDSSALRPVAKEAEPIPTNGASAAEAGSGSPLTLSLKLTVNLPVIPAEQRDRIAQRAREIMEQAATREFRHWETRSITSAIWNL
ncbi:MAG: hypothetical protein EBS68_15330 [Rhodobacteraceae bacterium]|nr:hypothetical protein [Paracoccaceae bacterium]